MASAEYNYCGIVYLHANASIFIRPGNCWYLGPSSRTKMATLVEGREYGLASNALSEGNKTVVHFKLTDTALKTLENFYKIKVTIFFSNIST